MIPIQTKILTFLSIFLALEGCSLSSTHDEGSSLYLDLSSLKAETSRFALLNSGGSALTAAAVPNAPPTTVGGFACYAVNVTGPGIGDSSRHADHPELTGMVFDKLLNNQATQKYCSYRGVVSRTVSLADSKDSGVTLQVPPGGVRLIQLVGINDPVVCDSGVVDDPPGSVSGNRFYEVGRAVIHDVFGDRSVGLSTNWPVAPAVQALRVMDCGDGSCSLVDKFNAAAAPLAGYGTYSKYAQRIPTIANQHIHAVDLNLGITAVDTIVVEIWESAAPSSAPEVATGFSATKSVIAGTGVGTYIFNLAGGGATPVMSAGKDYWLVVSASTVGNANGWRYLSGAGSPDTLQYAGTWSAMGGNMGFDYRLSVCGN